jgi:hypothetical protein
MVRLCEPNTLLGCCHLEQIRQMILPLESKWRWLEGFWNWLNNGGNAGDLFGHNGANHAKDQKEMFWHSVH